MSRANEKESLIAILQARLVTLEGELLADAQLDGVIPETLRGCFSAEKMTDEYLKYGDYSLNLAKYEGLLQKTIAHTGEGAGPVYAMREILARLQQAVAPYALERCYVEDKKINDTQQNKASLGMLGAEERTAFPISKDIERFNVKVDGLDISKIPPAAYRDAICEAFFGEAAVGSETPQQKVLLDALMLEGHQRLFSFVAQLAIAKLTQKLPVDHPVEACLGVESHLTWKHSTDDENTAVATIQYCCKGVLADNEFYVMAEDGHSLESMKMDDERMQFYKLPHSSEMELLKVFSCEMSIGLSVHGDPPQPHFDILASKFAVLSDECFTGFYNETSCSDGVLPAVDVSPDSASTPKGDNPAHAWRSLAEFRAAAPAVSWKEEVPAKADVPRPAGSFSDDRTPSSEGSPKGGAGGSGVSPPLARP